MIFQLVLAPSGDPFIRGDANQDQMVNLADAIFVADWLFQGGTDPTCPDAADANDDGFIDISDALKIILYLFLTGPPPPEPFPNAGQDGTFLDLIGC